MKKEIWKDIIGYEGYYQVSNLGRVKSLERTITYRAEYQSGKVIYKDKYVHQRILIPSQDNCGYLHVRLAKDGVFKLIKIHRLVAKHFLKEYREELTVDHIDQNKKNNNVKNLRMTTLVGNINSYNENHEKRYQYIDSNGEYFKLFRIYCNKHQLRYSKYYFIKSVTQHVPYHYDKSLTFKKIK